MVSVGQTGQKKRMRYMSSPHNLLLGGRIEMVPILPQE